MLSSDTKELKNMHYYWNLFIKVNLLSALALNEKIETLHSTLWIKGIGFWRKCRTFVKKYERRSKDIASFSKDVKIFLLKAFNCKLHALTPLHIKANKFRIGQSRKFRLQCGWKIAVVLASFMSFTWRKSFKGKFICAENICTCCGKQTFGAQCLCFYLIEPFFHKRARDWRPLRKPLYRSPLQGIFNRFVWKVKNTFF